jgi:hypothetical protein
MGSYAMIWHENQLAAQERGNYAFLQIPNVGDHVQLWNPRRHHFDLMEVVSIEHIPTPAPEQSGSDWEGLKRAAVLIVCKLIDELAH